LWLRKVLPAKLVQLVQLAQLAQQVQQAQQALLVQQAQLA
jgi:hypothetical protein